MTFNEALEDELDTKIEGFKEPFIEATVSGNKKSWRI
jgi:hypothetical protein